VSNKTRKVFAPEDFDSSGQAIVRCSYDGKDHHFGASVASKIGFLNQGGELWLLFNFTSRIR